MTNIVSNINNLHPFGGYNFDGNIFIYDTPIQLVNASTLSASSGNSTVSIVEYVPHDGYDYEILLSGTGYSSSSGNYGIIKVFSGTVTDFTDKQGQILCMRRVRTDASYHSCNTMWTPISKNDTNITLYNNGSASVTYSLYLIGFRRIGANGLAENYIEKISADNTDYTIGGANFDGPWVLDYYIPANAVTYAKNSATTYSLESFLPDDGADYLVSFSGWGRTPSGSGNCIYSLASGTKTYSEVEAGKTFIMRTEYHSTSTYACSGNVRIPIYANDRNVTIANLSSNATGSSGLYISAYQRIGTNDNDVKYKNVAYTQYAGDSDNIYYNSDIRDVNGNIIISNVFTEDQTDEIAQYRASKKGDYGVVKNDGIIIDDTISPITGYDPKWVASSGTEIIAVCSSSSSNKIYQTTNMYNWSSAPTSASPKGKIFYLNGYYITSSEDAISNYTVIYKSSNLSSWGSVSIFPKVGTIEAAIYTNGYYILCMLDRVYKTNDLSSVTKIFGGDNSDIQINDIAYNDSCILVATSDGIYKSNDYSNFTKISNLIVDKIIFGNNSFIALTNLKVYRSYNNGELWVDYNLDTEFNTEKLIYCNSLFIAISLDGYIMISGSGIKWTTPLKLSNAIYDICYFNSKKYLITIDNSSVIISNIDTLLNWQKLIDGQYINNGDYDITNDTKDFVVSYRE